MTFPAQVAVGTTLELEADFTNENGTPIDPTTVTGTIRDPAGVVTDLVPVRTQTGSYAAPFTPVLNGLHEYRFVGATPPLSSAVEGNFTAQTVFPAEGDS